MASVSRPSPAEAIQHRRTLNSVWQQGGGELKHKLWGFAAW